MPFIASASFFIDATLFFVQALLGRHFANAKCNIKIKIHEYIERSQQQQTLLSVYQPKKTCIFMKENRNLT